MLTSKDTDNQSPGSPEFDFSPCSPLEALRAALDSATANCGFGSRSDVEEHFDKPEIGRLSDSLHNRLREILKSDESSGFDTLDLHAAAGAFALERAIGVSDQRYDAIIKEILPCFGGGVALRPPTDDCWITAGEVGLGLSLLDCFRQPDQRHEAVSSAAARLVQLGYALTLEDGRVDRTGPAISEITEVIRGRLQRIGLMDSLSSLLGAARCCAVHEFDQYLLGRYYDVVSSEPAIPFGFLLNLVVQVADWPCTSKSPETDWREAVELARDLVAVIDVQPHNKFWTFNIKPRRIEELLNEVGHYDHLFGFRQWTLRFTPRLLRSFFGDDHDAALIDKCGWGVADAELLSAALVMTVRKEPQRTHARRPDVDGSRWLQTGSNAAVFRAREGKGQFRLRLTHRCGESKLDVPAADRGRQGDVCFGSSLDTRAGLLRGGSQRRCAKPCRGAQFRILSERARSDPWLRCSALLTCNPAWKA